MKDKGLLQTISDWLLDNSITKDWLENRSLRSSWYTWIVYVVVFFLIVSIPRSTPLLDYLSEMKYGVVGYRIFMTICATFGLIIYFMLTFHYFRHTIQLGNPIKIENVLLFYAGELAQFGLLYYFLFLTSAEFFKYDNTLISWSPLIRQLPLSSTKFYFFLYSAFESVGAKSVLLESNSVLVSILNYFQTLYSFSLVSLLIAAYINQRTNKSA